MEKNQKLNLLISILILLIVTITVDMISPNQNVSTYPTITKTQNK